MVSAKRTDDHAFVASGILQPRMYPHPRRVGEGVGQRGIAKHEQQSRLATARLRGLVLGLGIELAELRFFGRQAGPAMRQG